MAIKLLPGNILPVSVKGVETSESGAVERFEFTLICKRFNQRQIDEAMEGRTVSEFLQQVTQGWKSVLDVDGNPLPFNPELLEQLLLRPGVARLAFAGYLRDVEAREKN